MPRKTISEQALVNDRSISFDPLDNEIIERLFKKDIREGEEKLALAVLESAVEDFQKYVLSKDEKERKLFQEAEEWFLRKRAISFSPLSISARSWGSPRLTYGEDCSPGRKQSSRQVLLTTSAQLARS
jgi:hypothetical protein